jgi:hypothetical protein
MRTNQWLDVWDISKSEGHMVIEESMMEEKYMKPPGMLLSFKRLITYFYPLLLGMIFACVHSQQIIKRTPINKLSRFRQSPQTIMPHTGQYLEPYMEVLSPARHHGTIFSLYFIVIL